MTQRLLMGCFLFFFFLPIFCFGQEPGKPEEQTTLSAVLGMRGQATHSAGLGSVYHSALEQFLTLNMLGTLGPEFDFTFSFTLINPGDESISPYYQSGRRLLDNLVMDTRFQKWLGRIGFLWGDLSSLTFEAPNSKRPLLFDRDLNAGEEKLPDFYKRLFKEGFLNEAQLNPMEYFSGGRGGYYWLYRPLMGVHVENNDLPWGGYFKIYSGKAEGYFSKQKFLSEQGGRIGLNFDKAQWLEKTKVEVNAYNQSNDRGEVLGLGGDPASALQNNTVVSTLLGSQLIPNWKFEGELGRSFFNSETQGYEDWALNLENTFFLEKIFAWDFRLPVSVTYRKINPDFIGQQNSIIDSAIYASKRVYQSSLGDSSLLYNNEETWQMDAKFGGEQTLLRLIYGGRHQIHDTGNQVASTHFLDSIHNNGAAWWHIFFTNYGQTSNPAAQAYSSNAQGSRKIETMYYRGNTETITLKNPIPSRKYLSFLNFEIRQNLQPWFDLSNLFFLQLYSDFQNLHEQVEGSPFFKSSDLLFQSYAQAVLVYQLTQPVFVSAEYGLETWLSDQVEPGVRYLDKSYGAGVDLMLDDRTYVFFRWKHYQHTDQVILDNNFGAEQFYLEFKNYF